MPTIDLLEQLDSAIALAAQEEPREPSLTAAERLYEDNAALVEHFKRPWVIAELARKIRRQRFKTQMETDPQMVLGFKLPSVIVWRSDEEIEFKQVSLYKLRLHRKLVSKAHHGHKHPAVVKIDKAIALMEKYTPKHHGITWGEVVELEAKKKAAGKKGK